MAEPGARLRVASFNAENFYLLLDAPYTRDEIEALDADAYRAMNFSIFNPNKERGKIAQIARLVLDGDYDLVGLCEVGGRETLEHFNRAYLHGRYEIFIHEENSRRGIYVGALAKKGAFERIDARAMPGAFSRNLLRLRLRLAREGGSTVRERGRVDLEVFVVHLKSQRGEDRGIAERVREVESLSAMVPRRRCVVMGDFNGIAVRGMAQFEYEPFLALPFRDVLEAVGVPADERRTHYYFTPAPNHSQLDYVFCSEDLGVLDARAVEDEVPLTRDERRHLPSDHLLVEATLEVPLES